MFGDMQQHEIQVRKRAQGLPAYQPPQQCNVSQDYPGGSNFTRVAEIMIFGVEMSPDGTVLFVTAKWCGAWLALEQAPGHIWWGVIRYSIRCVLWQYQTVLLCVMFTCWGTLAQGSSGEPLCMVYQPSSCCARSMLLFLDIIVMGVDG
jgi:hypothetical protein